MSVEGPFMRKYACAQQGSYLRHQQLLDLRLAMEKLKQVPIENFQRYHEVQEDKVHTWQPVARFNSQMASFSTEPISYINPSLVSGGAAYRRSNESKRPAHRNFPNIKQEVSSFGPKHAEHARRFYQSKGTQSIQKFKQVMVPPHRTNYGAIQVSHHKRTQVTEGSNLLGKLVNDRSVNQTALYTDLNKGQVPTPVTSQSQSYETVLKVAKISPLPNKKQPTKTFGMKLFNHSVEQGLAKKSNVFQYSGSGIDLSNAPIFQMLCEISNTL